MATPTFFVSIAQAHLIDTADCVWKVLQMSWAQLFSIAAENLSIPQRLKCRGDGPTSTSALPLMSMLISTQGIEVILSNKLPLQFSDGEPLLVLIFVVDKFPWDPSANKSNKCNPVSPPVSLLIIKDGQLRFHILHYKECSPGSSLQMTLNF